MTADAADEGLGANKVPLMRSGLTRRVIGEFFQVYNELGYGFLESVYQESLARALRAAGLAVEKEVELRVFFRGLAVGAFRADLVVEGSLIVEIKAAERVADAHLAQLRNYLRATNLEVGLLLNFGPHADFKRVVFSNQDKIRVDPHTSASSA